METNVYHYTTRSQWRSIRSKGLQPSGACINHHVKGLLRSSRAPASYAFLEAEPKSWIGRNGWTYLMDYLTDLDQGDRVVLLEATVLPRDRAYVMDAADYPSGFCYSTDRKIIDELYGKYWNGRVPLGEYTPGKMRLPEVLIFHSIPSDRIHKVWEKSAKAVRERAKELADLVEAA